MDDSADFAYWRASAIPLVCKGERTSNDETVGVRAEAGSWQWEPSGSLCARRAIAS
jgi:hypothetical protein